MNLNRSLFDFVKKCPSAYHTVNTVKNMLSEAGYTELYEGDSWELKEGSKYYVVRNGTSLIAFNAKTSTKSFMITAVHSDFPAFRLKMTPETSGAYTRLEVERYGGMINYTWLDRPLSIAGRVLVRTSNGVEARLTDLDRDVCVIPSVAIHFNRTVNDGYKFNPAVDLLPLSGTAPGIMNEIASSVSSKAEDILSHDLFVYNRDEGREFGLANEFILCPRLDDLGCVYASLRGFLAAKESDSVQVLALFDNEEVGSNTKQGAASTFLSDTLSRIAGDDYGKALSNSLMLSVDNAHAKHPSHPELSDPDNAPVLNGGVVIKWNSNQSYATDGESMAVFKEICDRAGVKTQTFYNRADMLGGSTLGSISNTKVAVPTVDIGLPQLAMHSANETGGAKDLSEMISAITAFYSTSVKREGNKTIF